MSSGVRAPDAVTAVSTPTATSSLAAAIASGGSVPSSMRATDAAAVTELHDCGYAETHSGCTSSPWSASASR
jgi:hypothetical protein